MSLLTVFPFITPANYTYDSDFIEVSGGNAKIKDNFQGELLYNNFVTKDLLRSVAGDSVGVLSGAAAISTEKLVINNAIGALTYNPAGRLGADPNVGCIRFKYTPRYSFAPPINQAICNESNGTSNRIYLYHSTSGQLVLQFRDSGGVFIGAITLANWLPTALQTYEFEINFDSTTGTQKLYIDGVGGVDLGQTFTRTATATTQVFGSLSSAQNFEIDDYQRFDSMQHTSDFPSEIPRTVELLQYGQTNPTIEPNAGITTDLLISLTEIATKAGLDEVKYAIRVDSQAMYWDGLAWVNSNETYAQSNTIAEVNANAASLNLSLGVTLKVIMFLHSDDGSTTPEMESLTVESDFFNAGTTPNKCILFGEVYDNCCEPVEGAKITVDGDDYFYGSALVARQCIGTTDEDGKFELSVIETATNSKTVDITIEYIQDGKTKKTVYNNITIPDQATCSLASLVP